ncbi:hypothetical protein AB0I10_24790 [Streptomyces sp. NPDC050636]|uniref:hypothetical protein n=1 Tax=Streptomyces sp. NPDC050636 TaxID=3154510 RepID=UPI003444F183
MTDPRTRRTPGDLAGAAISATLLLASNGLTLYLTFLAALLITPDGSWDARETADTVQVLCVVSGAMAATVLALTTFIRATRWLRSRWWLAPPALFLLCSVARWLFPS